MNEKEHSCCGGHSHNSEGCCGGHSHENGCCCSGHSHNHQDENEQQYLTVLLENDEELKCSVLDIFEVNDKEYIALLPVGDHSHNHQDENEQQYLTVLLENDEELKCSVLDIFEVNDKEYIALLPVGDDQVLLYQYVEHSEEDFELLNIETDEEFEQVEEAFFDIFDEALFEDEADYDYDDYDDEDEQ